MTSLDFSADGVTPNPPSLNRATDKSTYESTKHHGSDDVNTTDRSSVKNTRPYLAEFYDCLRGHHSYEEIDAYDLCDAWTAAKAMRGGGYPSPPWSLMDVRPDAGRAPAPQAPAEPQGQEAPLVREGEGNAQYWHLRFDAALRERDEARAERDQRHADGIRGWRAAADRFIDLQAAQATAERLRAALADCIEDFADASQYKGDYLREKHGDDKRLAEYRAALSSSAEAPRQHRDAP